MRLEITAEQAEQLMADGKHVEIRYYYDTDAAVAKRKNGGKYTHKREQVRGHENVVRQAVTKSFRPDSQGDAVLHAINKVMKVGESMRRDKLETHVTKLVPALNAEQIGKVVTRFVDLGLLKKGA